MSDKASEQICQALNRYSDNKSGEHGQGWRGYSTWRPSSYDPAWLQTGDSRQEILVEDARAIVGGWTLGAEIERLHVAINCAAGNLESHLDPERKTGKDNEYVKYALRGLRECVARPVRENESFDVPPIGMNAQQLVDEFAANYRIHSNPFYYKGLKAGYDEILRRLRRYEELMDAAPRCQAGAKGLPMTNLSLEEAADILNRNKHRGCQRWRPERGLWMVSRPSDASTDVDGLMCQADAALVAECYLNRERNNLDTAGSWRWAVWQMTCGKWVKRPRHRAGDALSLTGTCRGRYRIVHRSDPDEGIFLYDDDLLSTDWQVVAELPERDDR